jgi:hypothetical protein
LNFSTGLPYDYQNCDVRRQNRFELVWRSSAGSVAERCCTIDVIKNMKKGRAQHHFIELGILETTALGALRTMMRTITNIRPAETPALGTLSWQQLDPILFPCKVTCSTTIRSPRCWYIEEYTVFLRKPQKISISELHLPILHVIRVKHTIIS